MKEILYKLPSEFLSKLEEIYPQNYQQILNTFLEKKLTTFRINYLKTNLIDLRKKLLEEKVSFKELSYPPGAFISNIPLRQLQQKALYINGLIYVQNVSSMLPVILLEPKNNEKILDLCAAPGTKTTQIVSLAKDAEVTAVEKDRIRYYKLLANLKIQGATTVKTFLLDGIWIRKKFPEYFDKILLDAPCTAEGRFYVNDPHTFKYWKERKVREMVHKQKKLLFAAFFALKEEGILVYSTCTFSPEENEGVIDWFINKFKDKIEIMPVQIPLKNVVCGLINWQDKKFSQSLRLCKRILPNEYMEGFFIAKLRKISV
ncbi:MAG: RsmB/NOP family class I SAM-dependent RNA methyltransferase [Candidatus Omnitrophica bacterium]|nr:RsmB/NOP family class I SAM-dependent RNA methyltransferase [Candidatus Omnitrophota bacterium]